MKKSPPRVAKLKILTFSKEGHGSAPWERPDGEWVSVEVPFSVPGDEVLIELHRRRKREYQGKPLEWLHLRESRIKPLCKHFGSCGGCRWQQIAYPDQLIQKESRIRSYFEPYLSSQVTLHPIIPCDPPWNYRNKIEYSFSQDKGGNRYLGLILNGTRGHVFQLEECHLSSPWFVACVQAVTKWWIDSGLDAYHGGKNTGSLRTLTVREGQRTGDRLVMLTVSGNPDYSIDQKQIQSFVDYLREMVEPSDPEQNLSIFLRIQQIAKGKPTQFFEMHLYGPDHMRERIEIQNSDGIRESLQFCISPTAFFQPNTRQAEKIYSRAIQLTQPLRGDTVYDLYCGTGTLGICMAKHVKEVIGIEIVPESVLDARDNIYNNGLSNVTIHRGDVGMVLPVLKQDRLQPPDIVMVDPPRAGLDAQAIKYLLELNAAKITYISCNPATQAINLEPFIKEGYHLQAIQPVDQFPHTVHVENIVVLSK